MWTLKKALPGLLAALGCFDLYAGETRARCGEILEGEFTKSGEVQTYFLDLDPGTQLDLVAIPLGTTLKTHLKLHEPTGNLIQVSNELWGGNADKPDRENHFVSNARIKTEPLSSRGRHNIKIYNWNAGVYSLYVSCTLRDGREVKAGSLDVSTAETESFVMPPMGASAEFPSPPAVAAAAPADAKSQLTAAAKGFLKEQGLSLLKKQVAKSATGQKYLGGLVSGGEGTETPPGQEPAAPSGTAGVAQELLVAAVAPSRAPVLRPAPQNFDSSAPAGITLYSDKGFIGGAESFLDSDANLKDNQIGNDAASSVRVAPGCVAVLYADANFAGKSVQVSQDLLSLRDSAIGNDSVSSIMVRCQNAAQF